VKNDSIIQSTCKRTTLANLIIWQESSGERVRSISELVRTSLEILEEQIKKGGISNISKTSEAMKIVDQFTKDNLNPSKRGRKNLFCNLAELSSISREVRKNKIIESTKTSKDEIDNIIRGKLNPLGNNSPQKTENYNNVENLEKGEEK